MGVIYDFDIERHRENALAVVRGIESDKGALQ